jgi:predicted dithiol-disulfide oxidoreductase (DUF899 family)
MCTLVIDSLNGLAHHLAQRLDLAIVAAGDPSPLRAHARRQGWDNLRLLSAPPDSAFKYDLGAEDEEGNPDSTIPFLLATLTGTVRHFYTAHPANGADVRERGLDLRFARIQHF